MAVTFDASVHKVTNSTSVTVALAVTPGACLIVGVATKGVANKSVSAVIANGVTMTQLARIETTPAANAIVETIFVLTASPTGTVSISVNLVGAAVATGVFAASYTNPNLNANPFTVATKQTTAQATNNISVSTSNNDRTIIFAAAIDVLTAGDVNATNRELDTSSFGVYFGDTAVNATSMSFSISTSIATNYSLAMIALNINFSTAATTTIRQWRALQFVGF